MIFARARAFNMTKRDVDSAEQVMKLRTAAYAAMVAGIAALGALIAGFPLMLALPAAALAGAAVYFGALFFADYSGRAAASIYQPSGSSTPAIREYSLADSLVARGQTAEAAEAYALLSEDFPNDAEPRLRHARLLRDKTQRYEDAAQIYKSALSIPKLKPETELVILRELIELFTHKLHAAPRALPYLARVVEKYASSNAGAWARAEMSDIKQAMLKQDGLEDGP